MNQVHLYLCELMGVRNSQTGCSIPMDYLPEGDAAAHNRSLVNCPKCLEKMGQMVTVLSRETAIDIPGAVDVDSRSRA